MPLLMPESALVNSDVSHARFLKRVQELYDKTGYVRFRWKTGDKVTYTQIKAIHLFCKWIAEACNDQGAYMEVNCSVFKKTMSCRWTGDSVKKHIWYPIQKSVFPETDSIKDLRVKEHDLAEIFDPIIAHLGNEGISLSFPNAEDLKREQTRQDRNFTGV